MGKGVLTVALRLGGVLGVAEGTEKCGVDTGVVAARPERGEPPGVGLEGVWVVAELWGVEAARSGRGKLPEGRLVRGSKLRGAVPVLLPGVGFGVPLGASGGGTPCVCVCGVCVCACV